MVSHSECNIWCFDGGLPETISMLTTFNGQSLLLIHSPNILNRNLMRPSPRIWSLVSPGRHRSWEPLRTESRPGGRSRRGEPEHGKYWAVFKTGMIHPTPTLVSLYEKNIVSWAHYTAVKFNYKPKIKRFFMALILLSVRPSVESVEQWRGLILIWNCIWRDGLIARSSYVNPL